MRGRRRFPVGRVICALAASMSVAMCGRAQEPPSTAAQGTENELPRSGALVGLNTGTGTNAGQTLWVAPVHGKIQVIAADDYVVPRKDGFWRVRLEMKWPDGTGQEQPGREAEAGSGDAQTQNGNIIYRRLWAVPLKKGKDAVPWAAAPPPTPKSEDDAEKQGDENTDLMEMAREAAEETAQEDLKFLGPDYISFYGSRDVVSSGGGTGSSERYSIVVPPSNLDSQGLVF